MKVIESDVVNSRAVVGSTQMRGGKKKQGHDQLACASSRRWSHAYAATLRSGMINSGAENLSITALSDAMEVSPSASWGSRHSSAMNIQHQSWRQSPDGSSCIDPS